MEIATLYNLDDIFYRVKNNQTAFWVVHNILISGAGQKIIYEVINPEKQTTDTIEEKKLQEMVNRGELYRSIEGVREALNKSVEKTIEGLENAKKKFLKAKLKRTLHGKPRKVNESADSIQKKISPPEEDAIDPDPNPILLNRKWTKKLINEFYKREKEEEDFPNF
ncbi:MAG: hypothetical protein WC495_05840 [Patescibacteria group bacterium]|jgi:hypothetical protein